MLKDQQGIPQYTRLIVSLKSVISAPPGTLLDTAFLLTLRSQDDQRSGTLTETGILRVGVNAGI